METISRRFNSICLYETGKVELDSDTSLFWREGALRVKLPDWGPEKILTLIQQNILDFVAIAKDYTESNYYGSQEFCQSNADDPEDENNEYNFMRIIYYTEWIFTHSLMHSTDPYLNSIFLKIHNDLSFGFNHCTSSMGNYTRTNPDYESDSEDVSEVKGQYYGSYIKPDVLECMYFYIKLSIRNIFQYWSRSDPVISLLIKKGHLDNIVDHIFTITFADREVGNTQTSENVFLLFQQLFKVDHMTPLEYHASLVASV